MKMDGLAMRFRTAVTVAALVLFGAANDLHAGDVKIGLQSIYVPWIVQLENIKEHGFAGKSVDFVKITSPEEVLDGIDSGAVDIVLGGNALVAEGYSRDIDLQVVYIYDNINDAEALVVDDSITAPQDLVGKTIAVPFSSTTHYHLLFALEQFRIPTDALTIHNLTPPEIVSAWERGDINGAFIWDPTLGRMKKTGHVLLTSRDLTNWGRPTFDSMIVSRTFAAENSDFVCRWVKMSAAADADYRMNPGTYDPGTDKALAIAKGSSGDPDRVGEVLALYEYPTLEEQVSATWLDGGVQSALQATAEFLMAQGILDRLPASFADAATPKFARMVFDGDCR